jgi:type IX secretion system PorP/SprF family membrane protein
MKKIILLVLLCSFVKLLSAQDPTFSQFNFNKLYLNPAFAGHNGGTSINFNNHSHLVRVPGDYRATSASIDFQSPCNNFGLGFMGMNEKEGVIPLSSSSFGVSAAYIFDNLIKDKQGANNEVGLNFSLGFALRYVNVNIDTDGAIFSSQLDHINGIISNTPNTQIMLTSKDYLDSDIGGVGVANFRNGDNLTVGVSLSHLAMTNPDESLQNRGVRRPAKYTVYGGYYKPFKIAKARFALSPHVLFNKQNQLESLTIGTYLSGNVTSEGSTGVYLGFFYQNTWYPSFQDANSFIINIGVNDIQPIGSKAVFSFGYSTDIPNRGLNLGTSHEISIRINFPDFSIMCPSGSGRIYVCPSF